MNTEMFSAHNSNNMAAMDPVEANAIENWYRNTGTAELIWEWRGWLVT